MTKISVIKSYISIDQGTVSTKALIQNLNSRMHLGLV